MAVAAPVAAVAPASTACGQRGRPPIIEGQARLLGSELPKSKHEVDVGQRVFHDKFGYGRVLTVDGNKLEIAFDKAGNKKVIDSFVTPA